jgi:hypothetical protein
VSFSPIRPGAALRALTACSLVFWSACADQPVGPSIPPSMEVQVGRAGPDEIERAIAAQNRHTPRLMSIPGVVGTAVGLNADGKAVVRVLLSRPDVAGLPGFVDEIPVMQTVTGLLVAHSDPTLRSRPAPVGYSVGHPLITAGTIGARVVRNGTGQLLLLSNNHVLANSNDASIGDATLQPGPYDGGTATDQVGTLFAFRAINFSGGNNTMDAAITLTTSTQTGFATPSDDGYGAPSKTIANDGNSDGVFDNVTGLLGLQVKKFGRTTKLTHAAITGINGTLSICYEVLFIFCVKSATFTDQLLIDASGFSDGGDSGSLIVTETGANPVGLLFAGSATQTIANRIDLVLNYFGVTVDDGGAPPPPASTDAAISAVNAPASVTVGSTVDVTVTVQNTGTQAINTPFDVNLQDVTAGASLGTQSVNSLAAGAATTLTFSWNTTGASPGDHTLTASHNLTDDNAANNQGSTVSTLGTGGSTGPIHIGNLDGFPSDDGSTWSATVEVTVHDQNHQVINGATVVGKWSVKGLNSNTCTTGELGGNGTCIFLFPSLRAKSVSFTVNSVTMTGRTYGAASNHDPDGSSNGTTIKVNRP